MFISEEIVSVLNTLAAHSGHRSAATLAAGQPEHFGETLVECESEGLLFVHTNGDVELTDAGRELLRRIEQQLTSLDRLNLGEQARLAYVSAGNYPRFQKLTSLGLAPGVPVRLQQKIPSFVIQVEETQVALEAEIARDIFVWRK